MYMLRDYQEEICSRVREAFKKHRSVMMQMPTGTGKTVVLAEIVREYLNVNVNVNVKGGCNVLIVAHRRELVEQIQQALLRVMGAGVARELPTQQSCDCLCAEGAAAREGCDCLTREGCDCLGSEGAGAQVSDY